MSITNNIFPGKIYINIRTDCAQPFIGIWIFKGILNKRYWFTEYTLQAGRYFETYLSYSKPMLDNMKENGLLIECNENIEKSIYNYILEIYEREEY